MLFVILDLLQSNKYSIVEYQIEDLLNTSHVPSLCFLRRFSMQLTAFMYSLLEHKYGAFLQWVLAVCKHVGLVFQSSLAVWVEAEPVYKTAQVLIILSVIV